MHRTLPASLIVILALGALGATAGPVSAARVKSASSESIRKLSPDLRRAARDRAGGPVVVSVLVAKGTRLDGLMERSATSRVVGNLQWIAGEVLPANLVKLTTIDGVVSVTSLNTFQPDPVPGERSERPARLSGKEARALVREAGKDAILYARREAKARTLAKRAKRPSTPVERATDAEPETAKVIDIHGVPTAWGNGYTGTGVIAAVVDTGVDFGHPDLQGTQARIAGGPYDGWPFAFETISGLSYVLDPSLTVGPDTYWNDNIDGIWYAHTLPVAGATCAGGTCSGALKIDFGSDAGWGWPPVVLTFTWPNTSQSGNYRYTVHPDFDLYLTASLFELGYSASPDLAPAAIIVSDETTAGVYDTIYIDTDFDQDLTDEKPIRKGDELAGADLFDEGGLPGADGIWDISAGLLAWISDGANPPPGLNVLYPGQAATPGAGELLIFIGDEEGHGTSAAGDVVAQGVISDPELWGSINELFAGGANLGGAGGPVLSGMAPSARVAAFQNGLALPLDAWTLAALGFDGIAGSGDEAQLVNNSWGNSDIIEDGWDEMSRFVHELNSTDAPNTLFLVSTGNGGHGYGTSARPDGGTIMGVGASTLYSTVIDFEIVPPAQFTWGDIAAWSNRGPTTLGELSPHVVAVGAWGTAADPLNLTVFYDEVADEYFGNGQASYIRFGGTSMASPVACGIMALVYQSFRNAAGRWPTWKEARNLAMNGATDLGYEVLAQGAGNLDAVRSTQMAAGLAWTVSPDSWVAGDYRGTRYESFPAVVFPGGSKTQVFTVGNPGAAPVSLGVDATELVQVHESTFDLPIPAGDPADFDLPTYVQEITNDIVAQNPDLVRAQIVFPFSAFDSNLDDSADQRWRVLFYDWSDNNTDGNLWTDTNTNGVVEFGEIDIDASTGIYEFTRFNYGYPSGTYLETSVGRNSLSRRHDGVFFGVQRREGFAEGSGTGAVTLKVRITYYRRLPWPWLTPSVANLNVSAHSASTFSLTLAVPPSTAPGVYQGAVSVSEGLTKTVVPVVVNVAAGSPTFNFGASSLVQAPSGRPYENGHLLGGFTWDWRYDAGDWRLFFYDVPDGQAGLGRRVLVDTQWRNTPTDVDTWVFGPAADAFSASSPGLFGPNGVELTGGSADTYLGDGIFDFETATGGPREVVAGDLRDGLNAIILHNVLYAGTEQHEPCRGRTFVVEADPFVVHELGPSGQWTETFTSSLDIPEGVAVEAFGLSQPVNLPSETIQQDTAGSPCSASWTQQLDLASCGLLEVTTRGGADMDIDLYLYRDGGNGLLDCDSGDDVEVASSLGFAADEIIRMTAPADGRYYILVHGYDVPAAPRQFSIRIRAVQGNGLTIVNPPAGGITGGTPVGFDVTWSGLTPEVWEGIVLLGPTYAPRVIQVPVYVVGVRKSSARSWSLYD